MNKFRQNKKTGFTLAEILITLAIIGVIASLTVPGLIQSQNKAQYVTGLKVFVGQLQEAIKKYAVDRGCINDYACTGLNSKSNAEAMKELGTVLNIAKDCSDGSQGCWYNGNTKDLVGRPGNNFDTAGTSSKALLTNGMSLQIENEGFSCSSNDSTKTGSLCSIIVVDINGKKGPNQWGRDVFNVFILKNLSIVGAGNTMCGGYDQYSYDWKGNEDENQNCNPEEYPESYGTECAGRIMEQGWQMNY